MDSHIPNKVDAVDREIRVLLNSATSDWQTVCVDDLSKLRGTALCVLVWSDLLELRLNVRAWSDAGPTVAVAQAVVSGRWQKPLADELRKVVPAFGNGRVMVQAEPEASYRLTADGVEAKKDLERNPAIVLMAAKQLLPGRVSLRIKNISDAVRKDTPGATAIAQANASVGDITVNCSPVLNLDPEVVASMLAQKKTVKGDDRNKHRPRKPSQVKRAKVNPFLKVFLADPVVKQALSRIKKKDSELASLLTDIEESVAKGSFPGSEPTEASLAILNEIFGPPDEDPGDKSGVTVEEMMAEFRAAEKEFEAEWRQKTGEVPPRMKTQDDVESVLSWWKEKAALAGIDPNAILKAKGDEMFGWEPIMKGRLNLLRLQAATLAATPSETGEAQPPVEAVKRPAVADVKPTVTLATPPPPGVYSLPMSKARMRTKMHLTSVKAFNSFAKLHGLIPGGNRQLWRIRLDNMDEATAKKLHGD